MSNPTHPHGRVIIRRMRPAWLLLGLVALLLSPCQFFSLGGAPAPATQPPAATVAATAQPANPPTPPSASVLPDDPRAAVIAAMRAELKAMPFRVVTTIDSGSTQMQTTTEIESPQRILLVSPSSSLKMVDGKCYEKKGDDIWRDCLNPAAGQALVTGISSLFDESVISASIANIQTVKLVGAETVDGILARIYEYNYAGDQSGVHAEGTVRLWVAEDSGLPIKMVTTGTTAGYSATSTQSIVYDPAITVRAP